MSGTSCSVAICKNTYYRQKKKKCGKIAFFTFPKDKSLQKEWIRRCFRKDPFNVSTSRICSIHFKKEDFIQDFQARIMGTEPKLRLKEHALPSLYLQPEIISPSLTHNILGTSKNLCHDAAISQRGHEISKSPRAARAHKRRRKDIVKTLIEAQEEVVSQIEQEQPMEDLSEIPSTSSESDSDILKRNYETVLKEKAELENRGHEISESPRAARAHKRRRKDIVKTLIEAQEEVVSQIEQEQPMVLSEIPSTSNESDADILKRNYETVLKEKAELEKKLNFSQQALFASEIKAEELEKAVREADESINSKIKNILSAFFTENQIQVLLKQRTKPRWTADEIAKAIDIRYFSRRCYVYLRQTLKYPLPGISTLQHWASNINLRSGHLTDVLRLMEISGKSKTLLQRMTVLSFDEVKVCQVYEYDQKEDKVVGPHKQLQVIMARGLFEQWKQPIFIGFDTTMTEAILNQAIALLNDKQYIVVACVCDMGGGNEGLLRKLGISVKKTFFLHPVTGNKIYFFADASYILKLIRNWLLDNGFTLHDGQLIKKDLLQELITHADTEISSIDKLTPLHLNVKKTQRQNVALAAELLSHTTATALKHYFRREEKLEKRQAAFAVGEFIELVNKWFDLMNSYVPEPKLKSKLPYGKDITEQSELIDKVIDTFEKLKCIGKESMQVFQKAIIISSRSLKALYEDMKIHHQQQYIITHRLNLGCLESLFSQIRTSRKLHDHPSPLNALYRIRMLILGKNPGDVQSETNIQPQEEQSTEEFVVAKVLRQAKITDVQPEAPSTSTVAEEELELQSNSSSSSSTGVVVDERQ